MRTLVIETATAACSVALFDGDSLIAARHEILGRGHAERLVPMIAELPDRGRAERILVSLGPGSFTGIRIGLAAGRALGLAWGASVHGYGTLTLVAAMAQAGHAEPVLVTMAGGHGEWFAQPFARDAAPLQPHRSLPPDQAISLFDTEVVAGSVAEDFVRLRGTGRALTVTPDAREAIWLPRAALTDTPSAVYGRPPDALAQSAPSLGQHRT